MKKILLLLAFIPTALCAQDKIHLLDGKTIEVKIVEIGNDIVYKEYTNPDGPSYRLSSDDIASIVLQDGKVIDINKVNLPAGFQRPKNVSTKRRTVYGDGVEIPEENYIYVFGKDGADSINSGFKFKRIGSTLTWVGLGAVAAGVVFTVAEITMLKSGEVSTSDKSLVTAAGTTAGLGVCCLIASIPLKSIGNHKINDVIDTYNNSQKHASLSFGATNYGIGLALRF